MYVIKEQQYLLELIAERNGQFVEQSKVDYSTKFILENSAVIIFPCMGNQGLLFCNEAEMNNVYSSNSGWPIEETANPFSKYKNDILQIHKNNGSLFIHKLQTQLNLELLIDYDENYLNSISLSLRKLIRKAGKNQSYSDLYLPIGIYCCSMLIKSEKAEWFLQKEYGINPYYIPCLLLKDGSLFSPWREILVNLKSNGKLSLHEILKEYIIK